jgi:hypothetical protein
MAFVNIKVTELTEDDLRRESNHHSPQHVAKQPYAGAGSRSNLAGLGILKTATVAWIMVGATVVFTVGHPPRSTAFQPVVRTAGRGATGSGNSRAQTFIVQVGAPLPPGVTCGAIGCAGYYRALISIAPSFEIAGDGKIRISLNATTKTLEQRDATGLAAIGWSVPSPEQSVREVRVTFNTGTVSASTQPYQLVIPPAATRLSHIDVIVSDWEGPKQLVFWPSFQPVHS